MADASAAGTLPQVFVVDTKGNSVSLPTRKDPRWTRVGQKFIFLLVGVSLLGLVVEGYFIYKLYNKTENLWSIKLLAQKGDNIMSQKELQGHSKIPAEELKRNPSAHLLGSSSPVREDSVVQWDHTSGDAFTHHMGYKNGCLLIEEGGYYYLYSKVHIKAAGECSLVKHKIMKHTTAYDRSIELMSSKSFHCHTPNTAGTKDEKTTGTEELWDTFLGGVFLLERGDQIFVILEDRRKIHQGPASNFMGAFMISPS
ncbi:lymphotoxin-alpha-like [Thalassophryne amazonica]|uniref:lymphotoxin-alpha-like n=1 Tax=Thalassophryne amazonica TaxID=390379 RepID=UPI00147269BB|nr:lymphotoxin-alpha-like [Thalassophryne amazonica]XP_034044163.1 lymphotoxin-alpha-like [Thalassophryne amazonica]